LINPCFSIFIKSEIWPNYITELIRNGSKIYLVEGSFKKNDWYFSFFNVFIKNKLKKFNKIFVQDKNSLDVLEKNNIKNVEVSGSLKFDRVKYQLTLNNKVEKINKLLKNKRVIVFGSTWQEDEKLIVKLIEKNKFANLFWIIAPHDISQTNINRIKNLFLSPVSIYSENKFNHNILIIDSIGDLKKLYSYAVIAYVGGGMGNTGLHNILEACVFKVPVLIGKNYTKFKESIDLVNLGGVISVKNQNEFNNQFEKLINDKNYRSQISNKTSNYFEGKTGATKKITKKISV
jgi:3-deoxy-D-manno-octulosonic-acid transferase